MIHILNSDILLPLRKRKRLIIEDCDNYQSEQWIWKEEINELKIWNYNYNGDSWHKMYQYTSKNEDHSIKILII